MNDCFELGESGIAWRMGQAAKGGAVPSMYFNWASYHEETNGLRPKDPVGHDTVDGISSSYQYYMERDCHVLMRKYSCWCRACRCVARRTVGALSASFKVSGCERTGSYYEWTNKTCGPMSGSDGAFTSELWSAAINLQRVAFSPLAARPLLSASATRRTTCAWRRS